jgi:PDZ domain
MKQAKFMARGFALLAMLTLATWAIAQESSSKDSKEKSDQQSSQQNQNQSSNKDSSSQQSDNRESASSNQSQNQSNRDANRSDRDAQNQSDRDRGSRSDRDSASSRDSRDSSARSSDRDRSDADRSRRDSERSADRDRSSRDSERDADRSTRSDDRRSRDSSDRRDRSRGEMRGPDIGLWFGRSGGSGLVIADISSKGAIAKVGFHEGDRIVSVNGRRVASEREFIDILFHSNVNRVTVIVIRDGREQTIYVEPAVLVREDAYVEVDPLERFGIIVDDRYDDRIVVWRVIPRSPAYYAGFRPGDVVVTFGGRPYKTRTEFERGAREWKTGETNVEIRRGDRTRELSVEVPRIDRSDDRNARRDDRMVRSASGESDSGTANRSSDRSNDNNQSQSNRRGGLLRGRGNR